MGARYINDESYVDTLDYLIIAICRDFRTRQRAIEEKSFRRRTLMEYEYLNRRLIEAASDVVGDDYETYIDEIGNKIGYAYSKIDDISETEYKCRKKEVKISIAKRLHLMD
jgi:hypothetical protein